MKKRYLAMLMAVMLCFGLFVTGAMAAEETAEETPLESTAATTPTATATVTEPTETPQSAESAQPAGDKVPTPVNYSVETARTVTADGSTGSSPESGIAIEGYGGTLVYSGFEPVTSAAPSPTWESETVANYFPHAYMSGKLVLTVTPDCPAGTYSFGVSHDDFSYSGTLTVMTLEQAITGGYVTGNSFKIYKHFTEPSASPTPLAGAKFTLYEGNDTNGENLGTTAGTDAEGKTTVTIPSDKLPGIYASPAPTFCLKETQAPSGYKATSEVWQFTCAAEWEKDTANNDATTKLNFTVTQVGAETDYEYFCLYNGTLGVNNEPDDTVYNGFMLEAWTNDAVTMHGGTLQRESRGMSGIRFAVYADEADAEAEATPLCTFTTGSDGTVELTTEQFGAANQPTTEANATYYLKQITAESTDTHGMRPMCPVVWELTATKTTTDGVDTITLAPPMVSDDDAFYGSRDTRDGTHYFRVYNERYASMSFDFTKTVNGANAGDNVFNFLLVYHYAEAGQLPVTLAFTGPDGTTTYPECTVTEDYKDTEGDTRPGYRTYTLSVPVSGARTVKSTVTISGWENSLYKGMIDLYEIGEAPADWTYADCAYVLSLPSTDDEDDPQPLLYDGVKLDYDRFVSVTAPMGGEDTLPGTWGGDDEAYRGYDGKWYHFDTRSASVSFVNTYTAADAPAATPSHSPKTGDEANWMLWLGLMTVSAAAIAFVTKKKAK